MVNRLLVGVGVMVIKDGKVLLSKRKGSHGEGEYSFPGGHLEYGESFYECAAREVREECGLEIQNVRFLFLSNVKKYMPKHYVHVGLTADWKSGEPQNLEPDRSSQWSWYKVDKIPKPMFEMCRQSFDSLKTGRNYYDAN